MTNPGVAAGPEAGRRAEPPSTERLSTDPLSAEPWGALSNLSVEEGIAIGAQLWRRIVLGLHLAFVVLVTLATVTVLTVDEQAAWERPAGLASLGAITVAYAVVARFGMPSAVRTRRQTCVVTAYLVVLVLGIGVLARVAPDGLFLLFIAYPQVWSLEERRAPSMVWTLLVFVASLAGVLLHQEQVHLGLVAAIGNELTGVVFSLLIGIWVHQLFDRNRDQAGLIGELGRTKAEVAALERDRGAQAERERLARDVHDTLAQGYTSILMLARTALAQLGTDPASARERLQLVEEVAQENLAQARALVAAQSRVELDGTSLRDALTQLARRFTRETGIDVDVRVAGESADAVPAGPGPADPIPAGSGQSGAAPPGWLALRPAQELVLLRAAQEALTNARRHASPSRVSLVLAAGGPGEAILRVVDDGVGFAAGTEPGTGLTGLRRRVEAAGGELRVTSAPGTGTEVLARLVSEP
ncbi:sensor histidine kinase [Frankia sp. AgB1.9]|uniref:sensor histidine kinase n=1 Tax=unclassified Frankia TaxID=2632575 RepID=UPI0019333227|nr:MULTISPECIES: sensor histidine kinase [unclassified Frankia]MBL7492764.1 sensor histidine kinase [Frankia sp. AgW1.1]MBL7552608.1 sensor histidine kinase [Frankia sp. AgB1.9]MBL7620771.1 sensor histidine kinase [Frankia sp. AgB1.8]